MDFRELLNLGHSKLFTNQIVDEVIANPQKMEDLIRIFTDGPAFITQRAAWAISVIAEKDPKLINPYYDLFIELLNQSNKHNAINRNIVRAFQYANIPEKYEGQVLDACFRLLKSSEEPVAVKAFSMTVIYNLSKKYPDIAIELKASIKSLLPDGSAGIKSRGNKILRAIQ
ncbi:MAG: hypothetical protein P1U41_06880 [Vicingaceae bacterium]|nr:hypothetical protein [Vicingaceae bacterium]